MSDNKRKVKVIYKPRNKNMYLRVLADGTLEVTCSRLVTMHQIAEFVQSKETWIQKQEQRMMNRQTESCTRTGSDGKTAVFMGKEYPVRIEYGNRNSMRFDGDTIVYTVKENNPDIIDVIFYNYAGEYIAQLLKDRRKYPDRWICEGYDRRYPSLTVRYMTSRWGSCTPARGTIRISSRLIHYPLECLDYVLLHEYVHLVVPNHSAKFYDMVRKFMPDYKVYSDLLKY